jgi:serine/threonine-protein kinase HipA
MSTFHRAESRVADALHVWWGSELVGVLAGDGDDLSFRYGARTPSKNQISRTMPVNDGTVAYDGAFFSNLLPDGVQRLRLAQRLGVSEGNTIALLRAIGGDCAGALSLLDPGIEPASLAPAKKPLTERFLREAREKGVIAATIDGDLRLSLAGAQDKLPVIEARGALFLPSGSSSSTHVLKLPSKSFAGLCSNEHFTMSLARDVGLRVAPTRLWRLPDGEQALLVDRYDRKDGVRLHQEDMCQACGKEPWSKYEKDGGPTFAEIVGVIRDASADAAADIAELLRWQAFNCLAGNNDGHAKNLSLLREPLVRLAPAYDLVCTRAWDELSKELALAVGNKHEAGFAGPYAWSEEADRCSVQPKLAIEIYREMHDLVRTKAKKTAERVIDEGAQATPVRNALAKIEKQCRTGAKLLRVEADWVARRAAHKKRAVTSQQ